MDLLTIMLLTTIAINGYVIYNLLRKIENVSDELDDLSMTLIDVYTDIKTSYDIMQQLDSRGVFEKDDETGTVFSGIKSVLEDLNDKYEIERE